MSGYWKSVLPVGVVAFAALLIWAMLHFGQVGTGWNITDQEFRKTVVFLLLLILMKGK